MNTIAPTGSFTATRVNKSTGKLEKVLYFLAAVQLGGWWVFQQVGEPIVIDTSKPGTY